MNVESLQRILQRLAELYGAGGAASEANDVKRVARALDGHGHKLVEEFVEETQKKFKAPATSRQNDPGQEAIADHSQRLLDAATDKQAFEVAFSLLGADRAVSKSEMFAIANVYLNRPSGGSHIFKFKSAKEAKARIRSVFIERLDAQSKKKSIEKLTRWS